MSRGKLLLAHKIINFAKLHICGGVYCAESKIIMSDLRNLLPPKIFEVVERAGISTFRQIMVMSVWDIKKLTNLRTDDITFLKNVAADYICPISVACDKFPKENELRVKTGCMEIDDLLNGGFRRGTLTEIYGESGSGKTLLAIQAAAHNSSAGCVFICTEDRFPVKRFAQMNHDLPNSSSHHDYGKNVYIEHITEAQNLLSCVRVSLPKLLEKCKPALIVIDSVAAPFRSEYSNYVQRAEDLRDLAISLISLAQKYNLAVLCINQVTASFDGTDNVLPTLGLAWSNMVSMRLCLKKTNQTIHIRHLPLESKEQEKFQSTEQATVVRKLSVIFSPDVCNSFVKFIITSRGIQSYN